MRRLSFAALLAFAFSIPLEDAVQFGIGRVSKVFGVLALLAWLVAILVSGRLRRLPGPFAIAAAFVGWAMLSYFWSAQPINSLAKGATLLQMLGVVLLVWDQTSTQERLIVLMRWFVAGSFTAAAVTFLAAGTGHATEGTRFASTNSGPNNTGALLAVAVAMACYLLRADRARWWRAFYAVFLPVAMVGTLLTASRTAALSLAVGLFLVVFDFRWLTPRRIMALGAVGFVAALLVVVYLPSRSADRLGTLHTSNETTTGTLNGRLTYWKLSFKIFSHHPVEGIGAGAFADENLLIGGGGKVAHNAFMSILAELGAVGVSLFVGTVAVAVWGLRGERRTLRRTWVAMGVTWFIGANALTWEVRKITWFLFALALVQARIIIDARREASGVLGAPADDPAAAGDLGGPAQDAREGQLVEPG